MEITCLRMENEALKKSALGAGMSSVSKVIQPTATVSSVPVSGPSKYFPLIQFYVVTYKCSYFSNWDC